MALPQPEPGLVIPYVYLWRREFEAGEESGRKLRPGLIIVVVVRSSQGPPRVAVCPITTQALGATRAAVEVPPRVRAHLGLDAAKSWIICDEYNEFDWPGVDLGQTPNRADHFGYVPDALINRVREEVLAARARGALKTVPRTE
jgi:mRNA-degrading endonuclease toxin of MazEF toxin-antitoxin module